MTTFRKIQIRPTVDIEFFPESEEFITTLNQFVAEGKILNVSETLSEDQLTQTKLLTFIDDETFLLWRYHPSIVAFGALRRKYDFENSILTEMDFIEDD